MEKSLFTERDIEHMNARGIDPGKVSKQIEIFKKGASFLRIVRPCTLGDGILSIPEEEQKKYAEHV